MRIEIREYDTYPTGLTEIEGGIHIKTIRDSDSLALLLYERNVEKVGKKIEIPIEAKNGKVWSASILGVDITKYQEYNLEDERGTFEDISGKAYSGADTWGKEVHGVRRSPIRVPEYDWEGDVRPRIPVHQSMVYRLNVRAFTKSASSKVIHRGSFCGLREKVSYIKDLGFNTILLMPCQEFDEVMHLHKKGMEEVGNNLWGYSRARHFAPKASFCKKKDRDVISEFKDLVKELHKQGMEIIVEFYFDGSEHISYILEVLRYWKSVYHIDGIFLTGEYPVDMIADDAYLSDIKIVTRKEASKGYDHVFLYQKEFRDTVRRFLKGDEGVLYDAMTRMRENTAGRRKLKFVADIEGFTLMDTFSYDRKHNEANGESNKDGTDYNYSWNCGFEGATKKVNVNLLRKKQIKNALLCTFLSQGIPMLAAGDEMGSTRQGNNNAYLEHKDLSYLNWKDLNKHKDIYEFVRNIIQFRKEHDIIRPEYEPRLMDSKNCGMPDMSYHGISAWQPEFEIYQRQIGILYWGAYGKENRDNIYIIYNMHWEKKDFALPKLKKGSEWYIKIDTDQRESFLPDDGLAAVNNTVTLSPRSIVLLLSR